MIDETELFQPSGVGLILPPARRTKKQLSMARMPSLRKFNSPTIPLSSASDASASEYFKPPMYRTRARLPVVTPKHSEALPSDAPELENSESPPVTAGDFSPLDAGDDLSRGDAPVAVVDPAAAIAIVERAVTTAAPMFVSVPPPVPMAPFVQVPLTLTTSVASTDSSGAALALRPMARVPRKIPLPPMVQVPPSISMPSSFLDTILRRASVETTAQQDEKKDELEIQLEPEPISILEQTASLSTAVAPATPVSMKAPTTAAAVGSSESTSEGDDDVPASDQAIRSPTWHAGRLPTFRMPESPSIVSTANPLASPDGDGESSLPLSASAVLECASPDPLITSSFLLRPSRLRTSSISEFELPTSSPHGRPPMSPDPTQNGWNLNSPSAHSPSGVAAASAEADGQLLLSDSPSSFTFQRVRSRPSADLARPGDLSPLQQHRSGPGSPSMNSSTINSSKRPSGLRPSAAPSAGIVTASSSPGTSHSSSTVTARLGRVRLAATAVGAFAAAAAAAKLSTTATMESNSPPEKPKMKKRVQRGFGSSVAK